MLLLCSCVILMIHYTHSQVLPSSFFFPTAETMSVNGSSATGNCSSITTGSSLFRCDVPTSSVLFDGNIPTLTGLDGDMWASQLLTLQTTNLFRREIIVNITTVVERIELLMFNCPEWGISTQTIRLATAISFAGTRSLLQSFNVPTITSCDSLVRTCIAHIIQQPVIVLEFVSPPDSIWTHLAEVTFYSTGTCPPDTIIDSSLPATVAMDFSTPTTSNTSLLTPSTTSMPDCTTVSSQCEACPSCSTSTALASVITAIATALLATVISVLVMCKCHPKFTPGRAETGTSAGGEGQEYEEVDGGRGGVAVSDPTYMEVDGGRGRGGGNTFQLKENEAYASTIHK